MKKFLAYSIAVLSVLLMFGIGVFRGMDKDHATFTWSYIGAIAFRSVTTSGLLLLGAIGLSWSVNWIRKN
jgi:hypothetical protein